MMISCVHRCNIIMFIPIHIYSHKCGCISGWGGAFAILWDRCCAWCRGVCYLADPPAGHGCLSTDSHRDVRRPGYLVIAEGCMFVQLTGSLPESDCNHYLDHHRDYICCYRYNVHVFLRHHLSCMLCACVARSHTHALQHRCVENFIRACVCVYAFHAWAIESYGPRPGMGPKIDVSFDHN